MGKDGTAPAALKVRLRQDAAGAVRIQKNMIP